ncbi:TetR/AcrR family transcriptional regulator [Sinomonas sp.]|uniref:TetR/AcrR family transcriptional regulator n=1 Tax=Sinomonas sp. TaxID=1914986 RepID=UPI002FE3A826
MATRTESDTARRGAEAKERILEAAVEVFGTDGYRGGSLRKVADQAGLTLPGLLHHFPSKEELLRALLQRRDQILAAENAAEFPHLDIVEQFAFVARRNMKNPGMARLFIILAAESTDPTHAAHEFFKSRYLRTEQTVRDSILTQQASGVLRDDLDAEAQAHAVLAISDGLQLRWLLNPDFDLAEAVTAALSHLRAPHRHTA